MFQSIQAKGRGTGGGGSFLKAEFSRTGKVKNLIFKLELQMPDKDFFPADVHNDIFLSPE